MKIIKLSIIILFIFGCKKQNSEYFLQDFNSIEVIRDVVNKELTGVNIGPVDRYGLIRDLFYLNNELLMLDVKSDSILVKYNFENGVTKSFTKGEGPNEIISPEFIKITSYTNFEDDIQLYDFNRGLFKINLETIKKDNYFILQDYKEFHTAIQSVSLLKKNMFAIANLDVDTEFLLYNKEKDVTKKVKRIDVPDLVNVVDYLKATNTNDLGFNEKNQVIYTWDGDLNKIKVFDIEGNFIKTFIYGKNKNITGHKFSRKMFYYSNVKNHGDYIYAVYSGFNSYQKLTDTFFSNLKSEVHLFNIKTNQVTRYTLDRLVSSCTIDFENKIMYCIEENNESQPLVKYEIN